MPNFYIDLDIGGGVIRDEEGKDFPDRETAGREAIEALPEIAIENQRRGDWLDIIAYVRDDAGRIILTATLVLTTQWADQ